MSRYRRRSKKSTRSRLLDRVAGFLTKRARLVAGIWLVLVTLLAVQGRDLEQGLAFHPLLVDGTASKREHELATRQFGSAYALVVLLRGPSSAVEHQGRDLEKRLDRMPHLRVVSPWSPGPAIEGLRPRPGAGALVVQVQSTDDEDISAILPPIQRQVDAAVAGPVHASIAGFPAIADSYRSANNRAAALGELIALPVLLLVLLFVFRSVLAAVMPVIIGGAVVAATRGVLSLLMGLIEVDLFALAAVGMMGLALGVDYSLLVVSRFREEFDGSDVSGAVETTVRVTARSILPAGCGLLLATVVSSQVLPGSIAQSAAIAVGIVTLLSMISALCVVPALLTLLGTNLDRWSLPKRRAPQAASLRWSRRLVGHPRAVVAIMIVMVLCAGWALTLKSGALTIELLPSGDSGRHQQEDVARALGPGWVAPIEVIMNGRGTPVTSRGRLQALAAFQRDVEADPGIDSVAGFRRIADGAKRVYDIEGELARQEGGLDRLSTGIARAHDGAALNTNGLLKAAEGARAVDAGVDATGAGAGLLANALQSASSGSKQLTSALGRADEGGGQLAEGTSKASSGAGRIADGLAQAEEKTDDIEGTARLLKNAMRTGNERLSELHPPLRITEEQLAAALAALQRMSTGRSDPEYAAALRAVEEAGLHLSGKDPQTGEQADPSFKGVEDGIERAEGQFGVGLYLAEGLDKTGRQASKGIKKLAAGSEKLDHGLQRLSTGSRRLSDGIAALSDGGEKIPPALMRLGEGAERLAGGLGQLGIGTGQLADGLGAGAQKSKLLTGGLHRIDMALERNGGASGFDQLHEQSPNLFRSAYFVLASLDGTQPQRRNQLGFLINLDRGGQSARMLVIPRYETPSAEAEETTVRLESQADDLGRKTGTEVVVGGVTPGQIDIDNEFRTDALILRLALSLITFLILVPVVRSLTLPLIAALLNLVTVSASFGVLSLLFNGSLLGGPGYIDTTIIPASIMIMFGLAIDYEVFIFARIREEYVRTGSTSAAISNGLDHTAHVVSGAAMIMIAVFLAFSVSDFMTIRNFGVAQAVAVFIDAFIVRLVVVPTLMGWLGKWNWWMPGWLDRLLPGGAPIPAGADSSEPR